MHALYYKLFKGKTQLHKRDFRHRLFGSGWDASYKKHVGHARTLYSGSKILFPIETSLYLSNSSDNNYFKQADGTYTQKEVEHVEMVRILVNIEDCN